MTLMVIPVGRGRIGKTWTAWSLGEALHALGDRVTLFDLDRARSLSKRRKLARRPSSAADTARRLALEDAIHEAVGGEAFDTAVIDIGGDDVIWHDITDKLPTLDKLLEESGVTTVAVHVLGPNADKDLEYYRKVINTRTFSVQLVALNYGLAPEGVHPKAAFKATREAINGAEPFIIGKLPPEVIEIAEDPDKLNGRTLAELATDTPMLKTINAAVLRSWLNTSIKPLAKAIRSYEQPAPPLAA